MNSLIRIARWLPNYWNSFSNVFFWLLLKICRFIEIVIEHLCKVNNLQSLFRLQYEGETDKFDVHVQRYVADESVLDNGVKYPEAACYCTGEAGTCPDLAPGAMNVSSCKFGAPAFLSFPHFYLGDESYRSHIDGMTPNAAEHQFYMLIQRSLGIPMEVRAGMQINLLMDEYFTMGWVQGSGNLYSETWIQENPRFLEIFLF